MYLERCSQYTVTKKRDYNTKQNVLGDGPLPHSLSTNTISTYTLTEKILEKQ